MRDLYIFFNGKNIDTEICSTNFVNIFVFLFFKINSSMCTPLKITNFNLQMFKMILMMTILYFK